MGREAGLHGGPLRPAELPRPGHRKQGWLNYAGLALKLNHLAAVEGRSPRCIGHRMFSVQFLSPGLESAQH